MNEQVEREKVGKIVLQDLARQTILKPKLVFCSYFIRPTTVLLSAPNDGNETPNSPPLTFLPLERGALVLTADTEVEAEANAPEAPGATFSLAPEGESEIDDASGDDGGRGSDEDCVLLRLRWARTLCGLDLRC